MGAARAQGSAVISIRWEKSPRIPDLYHGYVGAVRAFSLEVRAYGCELDVKLPGPNGTRPMEKCASKEAAKQAANRLLTEFLAQINPSVSP